MPQMAPLPFMALSLFTILTFLSIVSVLHYQNMKSKHSVSIRSLATKMNLKW